MNLENKKVSVLGLARSGIAAAKKLKMCGANIFLSEKRNKDKIDIGDDFLEGFSYEFGGHSKKILDSDLIIISPGVPIKLEVLQEAKSRNIPIWNEIELGYQILKNKNCIIIAVTGSNGKSTTVSLIQHILKNSGRNSILSGNIGHPLTAFPIEKDIYDFVVIEVSSFQLDAIYEFRPKVSIILNITPDHLNRYESFSEYCASKARILSNQIKNDLAIMNYDDEIIRNIADSRYIEAKKIFYSTTKKANKSAFLADNSINIVDRGKKRVELAFSEIPLVGLHNLGNILAASLACLHQNISAKEIEQGVLSFQGLKHRLEFVKRINKVDFINDSKATNSFSVLSALQSFQKPVNLIMGGSNKNEDFSNLKSIVQKKVRNLVLLGETKEILKETFSDIVKIITVESLKEAVYKALSLAKKDDIVLFSPGCASFDMFNNFEERGNRFKQIVTNLYL